MRKRMSAIGLGQYRTKNKLDASEADNIQLKAVVSDWKDEYNHLKQDSEKRFQVKGRDLRSSRSAFSKGKSYWGDFHPELHPSVGEGEAYSRDPSEGRDYSKFTDRAWWSQGKAEDWPINDSWTKEYIDELKGELASCSKDLNAEKRQNLSLSSKIDEAKNTISDFQKKLDDSQTLIAAKDEEIGSVKSALSLKETELARAKHECEAAAAKIEQKDSDLERYSKIVDNKEENITNLENIIKDKDQIIQEKLSHVAQLKRILDLRGVSTKPEDDGE